METEMANGAKSRVRRRRRNTCVLLTAAVLISLLLLIIILALTVFKARRPVTTINSVSLSDLQLSLRGLSGLSLNLSLAVDVSVRNPNKVGFRYHNSSAFLDYRGEQVGEAPIPAGDISPGETLPLNLTLTIMADRFLSSSNVVSDVLAGTLPLSAQTSVSGKVTVLGFVHIHVVSHSTCNFTLSIANRNISDSGCTYKTKF